MTLRGRHTKIVATLGPGSKAPDTVRLLAEAGVDIFRLNFSHGSHEDHGKALDAVRAAETRLGRPLAALADLQGPKVRVGAFEGGGLKLKFRGEYALIAGETAGADEIPVPHPEILDALEEGDLILLNDGALALTVLQTGGTPKVRAEIPGTLTDRKGFTVRGKALPVRALTDKDRIDLDYALEAGVDVVALSFVQSADDVMEAKAIIAGRAPLVAKIEKPAAVAELDAVVEAADAVMVARGDLGVEFPPEMVPVIQRRIIRCARGFGRPVIVATQMLESMIEHAAPTRAEATDVATAVYQGADAVMLSAETAVGRHPATAVAVMNRIIKATEGAEDYPRSLGQFAGDIDGQAAMDVIARATQSLADAEQALAIALRTGSTDRLARFARIRCTRPTLYGSVDARRLRQSQLFWGVEPIALKDPDAPDWPCQLMTAAGVDGAVAYAAWKGEEGVTAWEVGFDRRKA